MDFKLHAPYQPTGDQPQAIEALTRGVELGFHEQVMLGVTGSGKTFTMANIIERVQRPTLVISHNKTLPAQLHGEFNEFYPERESAELWMMATEEMHRAQGGLWRDFEWKK